jgi:transcriptional regulator with GAF, ATPase, and Fis domain
MKNLFKIPILLIIPFVLVILYSVPSSLNDKILQAEIFFYQLIKPAESLTEDIVIITIGDEDVKVLDGWPISRDYYSYAIHALQQSGAVAMGVDLFFSGPDKRYPRYDSTMADFMSLAGNVVLPMFFSKLQISNKKQDLMRGENAHYSLPLISQAAAANGFSNLGSVPVIYSVPIIVNTSEGDRYSFAAELYNISKNMALSLKDRINQNQDKGFSKAREQNGFIHLNYPDFDTLPLQYSFVNLLQIFRTEPDSIRMNGKIAVVLNNITGVTQIKSIPLQENIPASYIHIAALNNLLLQNWLNIAPWSLTWLLIFFFGIVFPLEWPMQRRERKNWLILFIWATYVIIALICCILLQLVLPLIYPLIALILGFMVAKVTQSQLLQSESEFQKNALNSQLDKKENQLEATRAQLKDLHDYLEQESEISEKNRQKVLQQKEAIAVLEKEISDLRAYSRPIKKSKDFEVAGIVYAKTSPMQKVMDLVLKVSSDDIAVLISGETGTGKELIAQTIHGQSKRQKEPFIAINCGALAETLLESELFGHEKGSFTGATALRKGRFELADGGTVFLDEVTETSAAFQSRLLRILQESTFERVGGQKELKTDIRIIAATNKDIQKLIEQDKFRTDLFYRLNGFPITVPPLRERSDDIALLANHFIKKHGYDNITGLSSQAMQILINYTWPGNVRELENCVRRAAILARSEESTLIQESDLPQDIRGPKSDEQLQIVHKPLEDQILELIRSFKFSRSSIVQTANLLGNRDRGTITEYFRGICFQHLVEAGYDLDAAVTNMAGSADKVSCDNLKKKISSYLSNLEEYTGLPPQAGNPTNQQAPPFRGLPAKFDTYLDQILANLEKLLSH